MEDDECLCWLFFRIVLFERVTENFSSARRLQRDAVDVQWQYCSVCFEDFLVFDAVHAVAADNKRGHALGARIVIPCLDSLVLDEHVREKRTWVFVMEGDEKVVFYNLLDKLFEHAVSDVDWFLKVGFVWY